MARHRRTSGGTWTVLVPVVALVAGTLFGVSSSAAGGTDLRTDRSDLTQLIKARESSVAGYESSRKQLAEDVAQLQETIGQDDSAVAAAQAEAASVAEPAGFTALQGPAVQVTLNDAPLGPNGELPANARPDDVVIHQSDVQAVVNAMWAAGADAITIMGERIVNISAVRCVGNTLLLQGVTYSPPFKIVAIGDQKKIEELLGTAPGVELFLQAVDAFGLGYEVERLDQATAPAYDGPLGVGVATPVK